MTRRDYLQYGRYQYGLRQYGKYKGEEVPDKETSTYGFKKARIRARIGDNYTPWVLQHAPVAFKGQVPILRLSSNTGDVLLAQQLTLPGYHPKIRLTTKQERLISEMI